MWNDSRLAFFDKYELPIEEIQPITVSNLCNFSFVTVSFKILFSLQKPIRTISALSFTVKDLETIKIPHS